MQKPQVQASHSPPHPKWSQLLLIICCTAGPLLSSISSADIFFSFPTSSSAISTASLPAPQTACVSCRSLSQSPSRLRSYQVSFYSFAIVHKLPGLRTPPLRCDWIARHHPSSPIPIHISTLLLLPSFPLLSSPLLLPFITHLPIELAG